MLVNNYDNKISVDVFVSTTERVRYTKLELSMLQLGVKREFDTMGHETSAALTLAQLKEGESGVLDRLDLPEDVARRLMELGFLPGHTIVPARSAPGGNPRVYRVDGSEVALRRETAAHLFLRVSGKAKS